MEKESAHGKDLAILVEKYVNNTCSKEELLQLLDLAKEDSTELLEAMKLQWNEAKAQRPGEQQHWDGLFVSMMEKAKDAGDASGQAVESPADVYRIDRSKRIWIRMAAAAAVVVVLFTAAFFMFQKENRDAAQNIAGNQSAHDIAPGGDKAVLTLADGSKIVLDTASNGALAQQDGIKVLKIGGQLSYRSENNSTQVLYNTVSTPKGGQYQLQLADGTKVWLNAASSLRFPTAFTGKERTVELTGEGFFEVTHNAAMPFRVKVGEMEVKDLGTQFNVDAYGDETDIRTTLVEGSAMISSKNLKRAAVLKPEEQAVVNDVELVVKKGVDVDAITAWKNGQFIFNSTRLSQIMKQVARWYDVEVEYHGKVQDKKFSGIVSRKSNLSEVLNIMKMAGVNFKVQGKKITVL